MRNLLNRRSVAGTVTSIAAAVALLLTGCVSGGGDKASSDEPVAITYWDTETTATRAPVIKQMIADFERANPTIKVTYVGLPSSTYQQKVDTAIATGSTPDVITTTPHDVSNWVAQGVLEPLDARFAAGGWTDKISESMVQTARSFVGDEKLYLAPDGALTNALWLNLGTFKSAGVEVPTTWDEFYAAAKALTHPEENQFGYIFRGGAGMFPQLLCMMYGMSGVTGSFDGVTGFFDADGNSTLNDPRNVVALERYVSLYGNETATGDLTADYVVMTAEFGAGTGAMMSHNLGSYQDNVKALGADNILGLQPFPSEAGPVTEAGFSVTGNAIFKAGKHKDAAWKFIEYFLSPEGNAYWNKEGGQLPSNLEVAKQPWLQAQQPMKAATDALNDPETVVLHEPWYLPEYDSIAKTQLEPEWQKVLQGKLTAKAFLDEAASSFTEAEAAYIERNSK